MAFNIHFIAVLANSVLPVSLGPKQQRALKDLSSLIQSFKNPDKINLDKMFALVVFILCRFANSKFLRIVVYLRCIAYFGYFRYRKIYISVLVLTNNNLNHICKIYTLMKKWTPYLFLHH